MKFLYAAVAAALVIPSVGCQSMSTLGGKSPLGAPSHITQSQQAPRPAIQRAAYMQSTGMVSQMPECPETGLFQRCGCDCYSNCGCGVDCGCGDCCSECNPCNNGCCRGGCGCRGCNGCCGGNCAVNGIVGRILDCTQTDASYNFTPGPPVAQAAYPYYTVRGPRDFLLSNPPTIGPGAYNPNCPY